MNSNDPSVSELALSAEEYEAIRTNGAFSRGSSTITIEGDLVRVQSSADQDLMHLKYILRVCEEVIKLHGRFYMLVVSSGSSLSMGPEQRRLGAQWSRQHPSSGTAVVNSGQNLINIMTMLLIRAVNALIPRAIPLAFFRSEPEARAWLETLRQPNSQPG